MVDDILVPDILDSRKARRLTSIAGGNSIGPSVFLLTALANNGIDESSISRAAGCELFHLATWAHDAVIDGIMVQGWPPEWMIINGDHIFSIALTLLSSGSERAGSVAWKMTSRMALGEIQYVREGPDCSPEEHMDMIADKYGSLFEASAELAGLEGNLDDESIEAVREYGKSLGIAYEVGNEILNFEEFVRKGRMILPILYQTDSDRTKDLMIEEKNARGLKQWCTDHGCFEKAKDRVMHYARRAISALSRTALNSKPMKDLCIWADERTAE